MSRDPIDGWPQATLCEAFFAVSLRMASDSEFCLAIAANIADSGILTYAACFPDSVVGFIADERLCSSEYVEFFIRIARDDLASFAPKTTQKNIDLEVLRELAVPLPPTAEQLEIVRRVEAAFKLADVIERRVAHATARAEKLTQSILGKAFRGELVVIEAELGRQEGRPYEPATTLLARIAAEQQQSNGTSKQRTRRDQGLSKQVLSTGSKNRE
jgi:type I restriction enzyme, S subunit